MDAEERAMLRATAETILSGTAAHRVGDPPVFDSGRWQALAEAGLLGVRIAPELGGAGLGQSALAVVCEAAGRLAPALPYLGAVVLFGEAVRRGAGRAEREAWLPRIAAGELIGAVALMDTPGEAATVRQDGDGLRLDGGKALVLGGPFAQTLLVSAQDAAGGVTLVSVDPQAPGVSRTDRMTYDGMAVSDFRFDGVRVAKAAQFGDAALIETVADAATAVLCAEAAATAALLNAQTKAYCETRVTFGEPLSERQVVRHRVVDMHAAAEYLAALAGRANEDAVFEGPGRARAVSAAKAAACAEGRFIAQSAVQLHGAIGTTEELDIGRMLRRMTAIELLFGGGDAHLARFRSSRGGQAGDRVAEVLGSLSEAEQAFRDEVRQFYAEALTPEMARAGRLLRWSFSEFEYGKRWQQVLHSRGWGAPHWPVEHGGQDWTPRQRIIFAMETMAAQPPSAMMMGRDLCAPCIMAFGTEAQKAEFLPRILDGTDWWAQGYSEPQAGSDLAALNLRADSDGDDYVLNGSKIWTTYAHHANRIFCLVRTSREDRPQKGISFLLIDMETPGIEVRPIVSIGGDHDFNQVFFTDVRVPKSRRLGEEGQGWAVARHLLQFEHGANITGPMILRLWLERAERLAARPGADGRRRIDDPAFANRLAAAAVELEAAETIAVREVRDGHAGAAAPGVYAELINLRLRNLRQHLTELTYEAAGEAALAHRPELLDVAGSEVASQDDLDAALALPLYFAQRAASIAGGTPEIHRNNIARGLFGKASSK